MAVHVDSAFNGANETIGAVSGILTAASSRIFADDVARIFYSNMSTEFDKFARLAAIANPESYAHMYDWKMLGQNGGKLWVNHLTGGAGRREVTYSFRPSVQPVPKMTTANTGIDSDELEKVTSNGKHRFPEKAMIFELGITTKISPKRGKSLFIPLKHVGRSGTKPINFQGEVSERDRNRGFTFYKGTVQQSHADTRGKFTSLYLLFYSQQSDRVFMEKVEPRINSRIKKVYTAETQNLGGPVNVRRGVRSRQKSFRVAAVVDNARKADRHMKAEMRAAVREAQDLLEGEDD